MDSDVSAQLIWPEKLIRELAKKREVHLWSFRLALINFCIASVIGVLLGPIQLALLAVTKSITLANEVYFPIMLSIALLITGLLAISIVVSLIRAWREEPANLVSLLILDGGAALIALIIWLVHFGANLAAYQLTPLLLLIIVACAVSAYLLRRFEYQPEHTTQKTALTITLALLVLLGGTEGIFGFTYLVGQANSAEEEQQQLELLAEQQRNARTTGVNDELSDLVQLLCQGNYDVVHMLSTSYGSDGLFECRAAHTVYAVSGPTAPVTNVIQGNAFYFGKTSDELINTYFPVNLGIKYLYRDLNPLAEANLAADPTFYAQTSPAPSELVMLLIAGNEDILVNAYLDHLLNVINHRDQTTDLLLSLFYTSELNNVLSTKDFILLAAADTINLIDALPGGHEYQGYLNGAMGTYIYSPNFDFGALRELGENYLLYSGQTLDALTNRRHITVTIQRNHTYDANELRELLYNGFLDPVGSTAENY